MRILIIKTKMEDSKNTLTRFEIYPGDTVEIVVPGAETIDGKERTVLTFRP